MRDCRVFLYGGTWPASYTLGFMEALMTGIPVVALGTRSAEPDRFEPFHFYEIPEIIKNGSNGFISDSLDELQSFIRLLLEDEKLARTISENGRKTAIEYFGKDKIAAQWKAFLG